MKKLQFPPAMPHFLGALLFIAIATNAAWPSVAAAFEEAAEYRQHPLPTACSLLLQNIARDPNLSQKTVHVNSLISCGQDTEVIFNQEVGDLTSDTTCLARFEVDNSPVVGYVDLANKVFIMWAPVESAGQWARGYQRVTNGEFYDWNSDIMDYGNFKSMADSSKVVAWISRETNRSSLFTPVRKTFFSYKTTCGTRSSAER